MSKRRRNFRFNLSFSHLLGVWLHCVIELNGDTALIKHCPFKMANVLIKGETCTYCSRVSLEASPVCDITYLVLIKWREVRNNIFKYFVNMKNRRKVWHWMIFFDTVIQIIPWGIGGIIFPQRSVQSTQVRILSYCKSPVTINFSLNSFLGLLIPVKINWELTFLCEKHILG